MASKKTDVSGFWSARNCIKKYKDAIVQILEERKYKNKITHMLNYLKKLVGQLAFFSLVFCLHSVIGPLGPFLAHQATHMSIHPCKCYRGISSPLYPFSYLGYHGKNACRWPCAGYRQNHSQRKWGSEIWATLKIQGICCAVDGCCLHTLRTAVPHCTVFYIVATWQNGQFCQTECILVSFTKAENPPKNYQTKKVCINRPYWLSVCLIAAWGLLYAPPWQWQRFTLNLSAFYSFWVAYTSTVHVKNLL